MQLLYGNDGTNYRMIDRSSEMTDGIQKTLLEFYSKYDFVSHPEKYSSVTKEPEADWEDLKPQILAEIMEHISLGEATLINTEEQEASNENEEIIGQIIGLLNARIRPAVKQDGGDIIFKSFENGIVFVEMKGNCAGCPYALVTLKEGVEKILKNYIPQVKEVRNFEKTKGEKS